MSDVETDILGRPLTEVEREVVAIHRSLESLVSRSDLAPCVLAGMRHALASTWQVMNDLNLRTERPEEHD